MLVSLTDVLPSFMKFIDEVNKNAPKINSDMIEISRLIAMNRRYQYD